VVLFYWFSFCLTIIAWLKALSHLCFGHFTRSALWFSIGCGMLFWWMGTDIDFDTWLRGSAAFVSLGALGTCARFYIRHQRAAEVPPFEPAPFEPAPVTVNININIDPRADRHAVHDDLVAPASALRGAIGAKQIPGPTVIDHGG
jgi:hypothetical protein